MKAFEIKIEPDALLDIQGGINWYNRQQPGLGRRFYAEIKASFKKLEIYPFYRTRYDDVRCYALQKFPYMIHYTLDEENKKIIVRAVFGTPGNPDLWTER